MEEQWNQRHQTINQGNSEQYLQKLAFIMVWQAWEWQLCLAFTVFY